ncbi:hypothetical protein CV102_13930 [Natronococcus pandeyae]|uniref:Uncharacterized protein n=1 Tax=Natronococcus pandeyae TaxID=2055836 RepID=A0A8J8Q5X1_9EURY|nr:hypothetical protein [Natronococcus pandeyae]TYL37830.1 hypothetical protein CV102_13930 [Natronococcus pandeyae]
MDRRLFTKAAGVSLAGALAGCTSLGPGSDDDSDGTDDTDTLADDEGETDDSTEADDDEQADDEEQEADEQDDDEQREEDDEEQTDDDEDVDEQTDDDEDDGDEEQNDEAEQDGDEEQEEDDQDDDDDDGPPEAGEMDAEISMDDELEGLLEVVHHEFSWESGQGSHLCNINLEVRNGSADHQLWFEAVGEITDENGNSLAGDVNQFGLDPEETGTFTFSVDQCADATGYRLTFDAHEVSEVSD